MVLTHLSLASLLWDIGKQNSPRCDATEPGVPSGAILFQQRNFIKKEIKIQITPNIPKNESGLTQMITMGESIRHIWVKTVIGLKIGVSESNFCQLFKFKELTEQTPTVVSVI